jgi:hypothetical protein
VLDEPDVPPAAPLVLLPAPAVDPSLPTGSLAPLEELELGEDEGEDELPEVELELGVLGVVALPEAAPEADPGRLFMSLELDPDEDDDPGVAPEVAPRLASPGLSQP